MKNVRYCVIFKGEVSDGTDINEVKEEIGNIFKADPSKMDQLFSGKRIIIKKNASLDECESIHRIFKDAGAISYIEEENDAISEISGPPPLPDREHRYGSKAAERPIKKADEKFCSNCGALIKIKSLSCPRCGKKQRKEGMGCLPVAAITFGIFVVGFAILGIIAAISIPQFAAYRTRAYKESVKTELKKVCRAEKKYYLENERYTNSIKELDYNAKPNISIKIVGLEKDCFSAKGEMKNLKKIYYINCDCVISNEKK